MELNKFISVSETLPRTQQQSSIIQDNAAKTAFALRMMERLPQEPAKVEEPPRIPSLGALAIPS